jgi:hypothetical protein
MRCIIIAILASMVASQGIDPASLAPIIEAAVRAGIIAGLTAKAGGTAVAGTAVAGTAVAGTAVVAGTAKTGATSSSLVCFTPTTALPCILGAALVAGGTYWANPTLFAGLRSDKFLCCEGTTGACTYQESYAIDTCSRGSYTLYNLPYDHSHTSVNLPAITLDGSRVTIDVTGLNLRHTTELTKERAEWFGQEYRHGDDLFKNAMGMFIPRCIEMYAKQFSRFMLLTQSEDHQIGFQLEPCVDASLKALGFPYARVGGFRVTVTA